MPRIYHRNCDWCKKWYDKRNERFCSNSCASYWKHSTIQFGFYKGMPPTRKWLTQKQCPLCNIKFQPKASKQKYCSKTCYYESVSRNFALDKHPMWKNGKTRTVAGYIAISIGKGKQVLEHRLVMEELIGRPLERSEHVHHINGDKTDNRIKNLKLLSHREHNKLHADEQWKTGGFRKI